MKTRVTELFGIEKPIVCGGMVWMSTAPLIAAVGEAGGIGLLAGGSFTPEGLAAEIDRVRQMTDKPFGVNVPLIYPIASELIDVILERGVKVVFTSAGSPKRFTPGLKEAGVSVVHVVPSSGLAKKCEDAGVDAVVAEGSESGGHLAFDEVGTLVLVPLVKKAVSIPVIAAGGIGTGAQAAAALVLGAEAVQIGTRFIASVECEGHENFKKAILAARETDTVVTGRAIAPVRNLKNDLSAAILKMEEEGATKEQILDFIGSGRSHKSSRDGDVAWGTVQCGQVVGLIQDILPARGIIDLIMKEAEEAVGRVHAAFEASRQ